MKGKGNDMMNLKQEKRYYSLTRELNEMIPKYEYQNMVVATAIALGKFNEEWLRKSLLLGIDEERFSYDEALMLKERYINFAEQFL